MVTTTTVLFIGIAIVALIGLIAVLMLAPFKHKIRVKQTYGNKNLVIDDKFKEIRGKDGTYWKLLKLKMIVPAAPDIVIEVGKRGKMIVTAYEINKGTLTWQLDRLEFTDDAAKAAFIKQTQPFTTEQRAAYMNQIAKAEREKKKSINDLIVAAAPIIGIVMIITVFLLFFGEAIQPIQQAASTAAGVSEDFKLAAQAIERACNPQVVPQIINTINSTRGAIPN